MQTYTPNYMLFSELGVSDVCGLALERRDELKILRADNRDKYVVKISDERRRVGISYERGIKEMCVKMGATIDDLEEDNFEDISGMHRAWQRKKYEEDMERKAQQSGNRIIYANLSHRPDYIKGQLSLEDKGFIWKIRAGLEEGGGCHLLREILSVNSAEEKRDPMHCI